MTGIRPRMNDTRFFEQAVRPCVLHWAQLPHLRSRFESLWSTLHVGIGLKAIPTDRYVEGTVSLQEHLRSYLKPSHMLLMNDTFIYASNSMRRVSLTVWLAYVGECSSTRAQVREFTYQ